MLRLAVLLLPACVLLTKQDMENWQSAHEEDSATADSADSDTDSDTDSDADADSDSDSDSDTDTDTDSDTDTDAPIADFTVPTFNIRMIAIHAATDPDDFPMGSAGDSAGDYTDHDVTFTHDFWIGETEATEAQWEAWTAAEDRNPSSYDAGDSYPVEYVSWHDVAMYANALSEAESLTPCYEGILWEGTLWADVAGDYDGSPYTIYDCPGYRMPTEAEWEYAARGGQDYDYSGSDTLGDVAWYSGNSGSQKNEVATLFQNAYGLYDMSGNVWELTNDWANDPGEWPDYEAGAAAQTDPTGADSGSFRVHRGGTWYGSGPSERVAGRNGDFPASVGSLGFRLARSSP